MFEIAWALIRPQSVQSVPWETLLAKLRNHYASMPSRTAHRYSFHHRNQHEGESINQYVAALRSAALYCELRDLDDVLDRLVCGIRDLLLQRCLLAKTDLTLQTVLDEDDATELSNKSMEEIQKSNSPPAVRKSTSVHHKELSPEEMTDEDEDIHCLKVA